MDQVSVDYQASPVSLYYLEALRKADRDLIDERDKRYAAERIGDQLATQVAKLAADDALKLHNGLLRQMREQQGTYALKSEVARLERWQTRISGGMIVLAAIGLTNLIKLWAGG